MIGRILVGLDGSEPAYAAVDFAAGLAKACKAELRGALVDDPGTRHRVVADTLPGLVMDPGFRPDVSRELMAIEEESRRNAEAVRTRTRKFFKGRNRFHVLEGEPVAVLLAESLKADLLAIGRTGRSNSSGPLGGVARRLARQCAEPVLVVRDAAPMPRKILVPYSGSIQSHRALKAAVRFARPLRVPIEVLSVQDSAEQAKTFAEEARDYLRPHKVRATFQAKTGRPFEQIVPAATRGGKTLLIMGAFGRSPLAEFVLGSTTEKVLDRVPGPVILCS
jgi:nucleotide-binding universal stress UspA family protein